jgi:hypothetical protein
MRPRVRPVLLMGALLMLIGSMVFAGACGSSDSTATTAAGATTTVAAETTTTAASTSGASGGIVVKGLVDNPMTLTVAELEKMAVVSVTAEHPKLGAQQYRGVRLSDLFTTLKVQSAATTLIMGASDGYMAEVPLADVKANADAMIAIGDDGKLNGVMPGMDGKAWVKDMVSMQFK